MEVDQVDDDKQSKHNEPIDHEDPDEEDKFLNDLELNDRIKHIVDKVKNLDMNQIGDAYKKKDTRLIIDKIEMQNFKSYQGNVTIGPLYHKFNAIVGPNGSGKSNLMESLLFVFGKRAKSMRLKKLTDLIHKSTNFPDIKYARVSVYFKEIRDKDDGTYEEISKELVITREINKASGNSKYYLDKHEITHDGLCNRLEEYGIDLKHNRFLILQGEVEQISMLANKAKPGSKEGGLLEFLEDIIGTNRYVNMINHLSKDTEDILDIKIAKEKRVKLCKGDVNKMEESKNVCIEYFKEEKSLFYLLYLEGKISTLEIQTELKAFFNVIIYLNSFKDIP